MGYFYILNDHNNNFITYFDIKNNFFGYYYTDNG